MELNHAIEIISSALETCGAVVVAGAFAFAMVRGAVHLVQRKPGAFGHLKVFVGKGLQLGLEFLVAADIIQTITVAPTRENLLLLALLIVVRTFLSWSITVEIEGCWPWQVGARERLQGGTHRP